MKKLLILLLALGTAQAVSPQPSTAVHPQIKRYWNADYAQDVNYKTISENLNFQAVTKTLPTDAFMIQACKEAVKAILKAPATAKFSQPKPTLYHVEGKVYVNTGLVDSQNGFGALLRSEYGCKSIFQGTSKGGTLYIWAYLMGE